MGGGASPVPGMYFRLLQRQRPFPPHDPSQGLFSLASISSVLFQRWCVLPSGPSYFLFSFGFRENYSFKWKFMPWKLSPNICLCPELFSFFQDSDFYRPKPWGHLSFCFWPHDASGSHFWGWAQNVPDTWVKDGGGVGGTKGKGKLTQGKNSLDCKSQVKQFAKIVMFL